MKRAFLNLGVFLSLISLTFSSCLKDSLQKPITPIDPSPWYSYSANWEEIEQKSGTGNWEAIPRGNYLNLWWDIDTATARKVGSYKYKSMRLGIGIDTAGYMVIRKELLSFITVKAGVPDTTATVQYLVLGDTSLVIRNMVSVPVTEIRYEKVK